MPIYSKQNTFIAAILVASVLFLSSCSQQQDPAITQVDEFINKLTINKSQAGWKRNLPRPPQLELSKDKQYLWELRTSKGNMLVKLLSKIAPMHVSSTIYLTRLGFYDNLKFHRVINGFMAQGGDPMGNGMGGPGYKYSGEFHDSAKHDKAGILSMANAGPGTDGSQFFLTFKATPHLNGRHTVFGEVVEGLDVLTAIEAAGTYSGQPKEDLRILSATIVVKDEG